MGLAGQRRRRAGLRRKEERGKRIKNMQLTAEKTRRCVYVGIDPGFDGAVAVLDADGEILDVSVCPAIKIGGSTSTKREVDAPRMAQVFVDAVNLARAAIIVAWLEKVGSMPKQGIASTFKFGRCAGAWEGILSTLSVLSAGLDSGSALRWELIGPKTWQKAVCTDLPGKDPKQKAEIFCRRRWPSWIAAHEVKGGLLGSAKRREGVFDSLCMAEAARRERGAGAR